MNLRQRVSIDGKKHGLTFHSASVRQALFMPCTIEVELGYDNKIEAASTREQMPGWLGKSLGLVIFDKDNPGVEWSYTGIIVRCTLSYNGVTIFASSEDHLLTVARKYKSFVNMDVSGIIKEIVNSALSDSDISAAKKSTAFSFFQQYNETDYECLLRLARLDGNVFYHDGNTFVISTELSGRKTIDLSAEDVFDVELNCTLGPTQWTAAPYDFVKHTEPASNRLQSSPLKPGGPAMGEKAYEASKEVYNKQVQALYNQTIVQKDSFETFLQHQQEYAAGKQLVLAGMTHNPGVVVGCAVKSGDVALLNEPFVVSSMLAEFGSDNVYVARFEALAENAKIAPPQPMARETGSLQPAVVIDNEDKELLGRVQIQYLWDEDGQACCWARLTQAGSGKVGSVSYGTHFTPRIGDHVLVGFEHSDPSLPVILGALYHSEKKPDMITKNGTQEVLVAKTPNQSTIRVLDKQGEEEVILAMRDNTNLIRMELQHPKITVESVDGTIIAHAKTVQVLADETMELRAKDIEMTAEKTITVKAGEDMSVEVQKDYSVDIGGKAEESVSSDKDVKVGGNLSEQASGEMALGATSAVKVEATQIESAASATNVIKGAMVQIN